MKMFTIETKQGCIRTCSKDFFETLNWFNKFYSCQEVISVREGVK